MRQQKKKVKYEYEFVKNYKKVSKKIKFAFNKRLLLLLNDPKNPALRNHMLKGNYIGYRSINVTGDWRLIFSVQYDYDGSKIIRCHLLGTHSQLYK